MSKLPEELRQKLASVCTDMHEFIKLANLLVSSQIGPEIEKQAASATDEFVSWGRVKPEDRDQMVQQLTFTPTAVIAGLRKLAQESEAAASASSMHRLGEPIRKEASQGAPMRESEKIWHGGFGNI